MMSFLFSKIGGILVSLLSVLAVMVSIFYKGKSSGKAQYEKEELDERLKAFQKDKENRDAVKNSTDDELIDGITKRK